MRLTVVGCSPAWPNPGGAQSGYLVESGGCGRLLLDCGGGVLARLRLSEHWPVLDAIAITHFHHDHCGDLFPWAVGAIYGPGAELERPELIVPAGGRGRLADLAQTLGHVPDLFGQAFRLREFDPDSPMEAAGFALRAVPVPHYETEALAFRVDDGARTVAYSGDSGPSPRLAETARDSDLFVCEATLTDLEPPPRGHLTLDEAREAFAASGSRRLLITHRPYERATEDLESAYEGLEISL